MNGLLKFLSSFPTKTAIALMVLMLSFQGLSQFQKGSWMVGPSVNYFKNVRETEDSQLQQTTTTMEGSTLRLHTGVFVADHHLAGVVLQFKVSNYHNQTVNGTRDFSESNKYKKPGVGLFYRYYVGLREKRLLFFIQGEGLYISATGEINESDATSLTTATGSGFEAGLRPGLAFTVNEKIAIEFCLGYFGYSRVDYKNVSSVNNWETSDSGFAAGFSLPSLFFGLSFYLGSKDLVK